MTYRIGTGTSALIAALALFELGCGNASKPGSSPTGGSGGANSGGAGNGTGGGAGGKASGGNSGTGAGGDATQSGVVPVDRTVVWRGNVGVEGGIPSRTAEVDCTRAPYNAHADSSDTATEIQACLDGIGKDQVAKLPAGIYRVGSTLRVPGQKSLRGAGPDKTTLLFTADLGADVTVHGDYTDGTSGGIDITSGYTKGSTKLTLADASKFSSGSFIYVSELNDSRIPVTISNTNGDCSYCGIYGANGTRARLQLAKVTGVSGNTVTISPPMYFDFSAANAPQALKTPDYVQYAGIESLTVKNDGTSYTKARKPVEFQGAANSWVRNVVVDKCGSRCIDLWFDVYRNEIRDSYITHCFDQQDSDNCYAVQVEAGSGNLVENVIFDSTANGILLVSASGNAFGYNYMHGVHRTASSDTWMWPDSWTHGGHSSFNLWEGNDMTALEFDFYWGSNSHDLAFRNRFHGMDATLTYDLPNLQSVGAILVFPDNNYMSAVGNVLGTAGFHDKYQETAYAVVSKPIWTIVENAFGVQSDKGMTTLLRHMNYDYVNRAVKHCDDAGEPGCQGGDATTTLPVSYYLGSKPRFFGSVAWPPIGPDVNGQAVELPAARCYQNTTGKGVAFNGDICYP